MHAMLLGPRSRLQRRKRILAVHDVHILGIVVPDEYIMDRLRDQFNLVKGRAVRWSIIWDHDAENMYIMDHLRDQVNLVKGRAVCCRGE